MRNMILPLAAERVLALRRPDAGPAAVLVVAETGSTNADLLADLGRITSPTLLAAERQHAGRGRAGRTWLTAPGQALTFSLAWKFHQPLQSLVGLPLAIGVVIASALAPFGVAAGLKWPNDVLIADQKLAGILIETAAASAKDEVWSVIGIGINITASASLQAQIGKPVACMPVPDLDRNALMAALLDGLVDSLPQFERDGFAAFIARWNALDAYAGKPVRIIDGDRLLHEGRNAGVDEIGRLLLDTVSGQVAVMAGDVSLRMQEGGSDAVTG